MKKNYRFKCETITFLIKDFFFICILFNFAHCNKANCVLTSATEVNCDVRDSGESV